MKNILVATYGTTWHLMVELLGFTNPDALPVYANHPKAADIAKLRNTYSLNNIDEIWMITTASTKAQETYHEYKTWHEKRFPAIPVHAIWSDELADLKTCEDCHRMKDLIFRAVVAAHEAADGGQVVLSMLAGIKTIGADLQEAGNIFGCHTLIHIFYDGKGTEFMPTPENFDGVFPPEILSKITPIIVSGSKKQAAYLYHNPNITTSNYPIILDGSNSAGTSLLDKIADYQHRAEVVLSNFAQEENQQKPVGNFRALAGLHPQIIDDLQNTFIGLDACKEQQELAWLRSLPKAELHCHFGGILSPAEMITVALAENEKISALRKENLEFDQYLKKIQTLVQAGRIIELRKKIREKQTLRKPVATISEPYGICGFLQQFEQKEELLEQVIFNDYIDPEVYQAIEIEPYEKLGDLQGSALMQSENCIRKACQILLEQCRKNNVKYLELRCSPINYTRGNLSGQDVIKIMLDELSASPDVYVTLLFIASRHGKMSDIYRHIELAEMLFEPHDDWREKDVSRFKARFVGFDLAGAEKARSPKELREPFETLHKQCQNLTIHAGETAEAESIWEAVYYLNADRIGHGLKLLGHDELLNRFVDHRIAVEMCPSSNFQICGFSDRTIPNSQDKPEYPLQKYLQRGLRVTVNTDNPGISRTDFSMEYLKAARMSPDGLSKWDILQLLNNSFTVTFAPFEVRRKHILEAEQIIMKQIEADYGA